jgi:hypothetical protein
MSPEISETGEEGESWTITSYFDAREAVSK